MCTSKERVNFSNRNWNARASNFLSPVTYKDLNHNQTNSMFSIKITLSNNRHLFRKLYNLLQLQLPKLPFSHTTQGHPFFSH